MQNRTQQSDVPYRERISSLYSFTFSLLIPVGTLNDFMSAIGRCYTVSHNYGNPYEKWNIFVARRLGNIMATTWHG